jgi:CheY-like chemotaxis protein
MSVPLPRSALILLVDDFEDALDIYEQYLTFKGYSVVTASNGADAIRIALREQPALILMDLQMAAMSGTQTMLTLRNDPQFNSCPIVAFTAHALESERVAALRDGFDDVIPKPCLPDELCARVDKILALS